MILGKYSIGMGDRFGFQGKAQLRAAVQAKANGLDIVPVWNKSHREHEITKTSPERVREEAGAAVKALHWSSAYFVDADHVGLETVDPFVPSSDFFTLDVADFTGRKAKNAEIAVFIQKHREHVGALSVPGLDETLHVTEEDVERIAGRYLRAVQEAGRIYRHLEAAKGTGNFVVEVSMDETDTPQTPVELFFILAAIAEEGIPAQTIAPKFCGRFNKGVDYVGDVDQFRQEFQADVCVLAHAVRLFGLPENLKLSIHSGSDKFSIYGPIHDIIQSHGIGLHIKTAGTTWLEELIGLASAGGEGLDIAREVYRSAFDRYDELCAPYAAVIDIDRAQLPMPETVSDWGADDYVLALRHDLSCAQYNKHFRQLLHVAYKVAAEMGERYTAALEHFEEDIAVNVTKNLFERHICPVFAGSSKGDCPQR